MVPASFPNSLVIPCVTALIGLIRPIPGLLNIELRRRTMRPLAMCAIGGYGLLCLAVVALVFVMKMA